MNYTLGAHECNPQGLIKYSEKTYYNKHMNFLGEKYYINKILIRYERSTDQRKNVGVSHHYINNIEQIKTRYNNLLLKSNNIENDKPY